MSEKRNARDKENESLLENAVLDVLIDSDMSSVSVRKLARELRERNWSVTDSWLKGWCTERGFKIEVRKGETSRAVRVSV